MAKKPVKQNEKEKEIFKGTDIGKQNAGGKIPYLETSIDKFYLLVKQKGRMDFYQAAAEYGVDKEQIASWARILEEHNLVKVHYPVFGSPVILVGEEKPKSGKGEGSEDETKETGTKGSGKRSLKIGMVLIAGLMVLAGYVMVANNPSTIAVRTQVTAAVQRLALLFWFLPYPLSIIAPVAIIIAILLIVLMIRRRRRSPKRWVPGKETKDRRRQETPSGKEAAKEAEKEEKKEQGKEKKKEQPKKKGRSDIEDKLSKIKEELGS